MDGWMDEWMNGAGRQGQNANVYQVKMWQKHDIRQPRPSHIILHLSTLLLTLSLLRCSFIVMYKNNKNFFDLSHSQSNHLTPVTREHCAISMQ